MGENYLQILNTYFRRPRSIASPPAIGALLMVVSLIVAVGTRGQTGPLGPLVVLSPMALIFLAMSLWFRFREQWVCERRRLVPHYAIPQLLIFLSMWFALACVWPAVLGIFTGADILSWIACTALVMAFCGWFAVGQSAASTVAFCGSFLLPMFILRQAVPGTAPNGLPPVLSGTLLVAAIAILALVIRHMTHMTEEDPAYLKGFAWGAKNAGWDSETAVIRGSTAPSHWLAPRLRLSSLESSGGGLIARSRKWRAVVKLNWLPLLTMPACMLLMMSGMLWGNRMAPNMRWTPLVFLLPMFALSPLQSVSIAWMQAWPNIEMDFTRPLSRQDLLAEIGMAMLIQLLQGLAIAAAPIFLVALFWVRPPVEDWLVCLMGAVVILCVESGVTLWGMRYRSKGTTGTILFGGAMLAVVVFVVAADNFRLLPIWLIVALLPALFVLGLFIIRLACRRWLETELG